MSRHYLVCTTPRAGSSLLCSLLAATGVAGMRRGTVVSYEYLLELVGRRAQRVAIDRFDLQRLRRHLSDAFERSSTANGVAGFKVMWGQIRLLALRLGRPAGDERFAFREFTALLPDDTRFVWLTRRDRLRQAVSLAKAVQSQCWNSAEQERFAGRYFFDYIGLLRISSMLRRDEDGWREFFERTAITPLRVTYEDVVRDRELQVRRILDFIDVRAVRQDDSGEVHYRRQSDALNDMWAARFERIRSLPLPARAAYTAWSVPRWAGLRLLRAWRVSRRVRRLPSGERVLLRNPADAAGREAKSE